jgi:UTP-glucose-1-phosphate uridylyltransferase
MTLVDRPLIQYAIDEARAAGIKEFIFVTSRGKSVLEDYFDIAPELERTLRKKGKIVMLEGHRQVVGYLRNDSRGARSQAALSSRVMSSQIQ